jgi:hypothetical protein
MEKVFGKLSDGTEYCHEELALSILLREGKLFCNTGKFQEDETVVLFVNCNDLFYWGTADAEHFTTEDISELYKMWEKDNLWGTDKWCCKHRNLQPQVPVKEDMKKQGVWEDWMDKLPEPEPS